MVMFIETDEICMNLTSYILMMCELLFVLCIKY